MKDEKDKEEVKRAIKAEKQKQTLCNIDKNQKGLTIIALIITILFSYDEKIKCSNSKGFLLATI